MAKFSFGGKQAAPFGSRDLGAKGKKSGKPMFGKKADKGAKKPFPFRKMK